MSTPMTQAQWIQQEQERMSRRLALADGIRATIQSFREDGYASDEIVDALRYCIEDIISQAWVVYHVSPEGVETQDSKFSYEDEAESAAEWLRQTRDAAQMIDGTTFVVRRRHA